ncbi:hypothetical protein [Oligoflexus tunisiensis]|uniref:hypothetical protein n=1 Tax=Oligoflexus tunisiensis TaxID=708132 RepID=UPI00114D186B|nr:hypothetical protein [Oligoflexus tunisiensis]
MMRILVSCLVLLSSACVTSGHIGPQGFSHDKLGYQLAYAEPQQKLFINKSWKLEADHKGQPRSFDTHHVQSKSSSGHEEKLYVKSTDLVFKHRETNGVISVQSSPLPETMAERKLPIIAKDYVERLSSQYFTFVGNGVDRAVIGKNYVTTITATRSGTIGSAETYEVVADLANADQLKLNPDHRLMRFKLLLVRPRTADAWKHDRILPGKKTQREDELTVKETYPAIIVLTYAMDHAYYDEYLRDFETLISRFKLRG